MQDCLARHGVQNLTTVEYGFFPRDPRPPGSRTDWHALCANLDGVLSSALQAARSAAWRDLPEGWTSPGWGGGNPVALPMPVLSVADGAMSLNMSLLVQHIKPKDWIDIAHIGAPPSQARLNVFVGGAENGYFRVLFRLVDDAGGTRVLGTPLLPIGAANTCAIQIIPAAGWVRLWANGKRMNDAVVPPWRWRAADTLVLGNPALTGVTVQQLRLAPFLTREDENAAEASQPARGAA
jgi:hypothetical protein